MKGLLLGLLSSLGSSFGSAPWAPQLSPLSAQHAEPATASPYIGHADYGDWSLSASLHGDCVAQSAGESMDVAGASIEVNCANTALGKVYQQLPANAWRQRRITLSAEVQVGEKMNASLWVKTQRGELTLMFEDDTEQALTAQVVSTSWQRRSVTLPVPAEASRISFGVLLQGAGQVLLRNVQVSFSQPGAIAPQPLQLLEAAIAIVKQQSDSHLQWRVLEPQLRIFASGAQTSAEVYPAIKYLLAQLGDQQSLLLMPEVAAMLGNAPTAATSSIHIFPLPDGAQLVLSAKSPALRTVQNLRPGAVTPSAN